MLNKERLLELNRKQDYSAIYSIFAEEYKELLSDFFSKNNVEINPDASFIELISALRDFQGGKYINIANYLIDIFFDDNTSLRDSINLSIDMYSKILSLLS